MIGIYVWWILPSSNNVDQLVPEALAPIPADSTGSPSSISVDQDAPSRSTNQTTHETQSSVIPQGVSDDYHDIEVAHMNNDPSSSIPFPKPGSEESFSSLIIVPSYVQFGNQPQELQVYVG